MITLFTGDNSFEMQRALRGVIDAFSGRPERIDGSTIELKNLPDLLMGSTLFAEKRLVIIKDLSQNKAVWDQLSNWLPRVSDDIQLVLVDEKPDKRTVGYKELKKAAEVKEFPGWGDRDYGFAESWLIQYAADHSLVLDKKSAQHIVARVGLDQWQLAQAVEKLLLLDTVSLDTIDNTIDPSPSENVFQLFETALDGDKKKVHAMIETLELTEEPFRLFALLSSQAFQLAGVGLAGAQDNPSKDLAIHPFVASKLSRHAKRLGKAGVTRILKIFADTDADMKISRGDPWLLIERALIEI